VHRYFKFQDDVQFSSNTTMEQLKHDESDSFLWLQYELLLPSHGLYYLRDRSLLMLWRNIIFTFFSYSFKSIGTLMCVAC